MRGIDSIETLLARRGKLGSCPACPIAIFCHIHLHPVAGQAVVLHAVQFSSLGFWAKGLVVTLENLYTIKMLLTLALN